MQSVTMEEGENVLRNTTKWMMVHDYLVSSLIVSLVAISMSIYSGTSLHLAIANNTEPVISSYFNPTWL